MKRNLAAGTLLAAFAFLGALSTFGLAQGHTTATAKRPAIRTLRLSGTPYERGLEHGKVMRAEIHELIVKWKRDLEKRHAQKPDVFIKEFAANTSFEKAIDKWTPGLLDEVRGIATGAGVDYRTMYVYQLIDETWAQGRLGRPQKVHKCTSIGVDRTEAHPTTIAQNLDIPRWYHGHQTLLHITDDKSGLQTFVVTIPGLVAANGMNSARIGVCVNTLLQLKPSTNGLPVAFAVRGVLQRKTWDAAKSFLKNVRHASGQNYLLGGPDLANSFECSSHKLVQFTPFKDARHTWHTNFPVVNDDYNPGLIARARKRGKDPKDMIRSCPRFELLERLLEKGTEVDFKSIVHALGSRESRIPICNASTFACTVMELGPSPRLHLSAGGPDKNAFQIFDFDSPKAAKPENRVRRAFPGK